MQSAESCLSWWTGAAELRFLRHFLIFVAISKYVSLGSVMGAAAFPVSLAFFTDFSSKQDVTTLIIAALVAALIIFLHRKNIVRIVTGKESRLSFKKK